MSSEQAEELEVLLIAELLSLTEDGSGPCIRTTFIERGVFHLNCSKLVRT